ncbi:histamine H3 receptor-like [Ptychodera flava]|uniref:histamine H3 receptor-like n=1 Tax=Ptychodera flava TaxID=63121 RepID=UPI00396A97F2
MLDVGNYTSTTQNVEYGVLEPPYSTTTSVVITIVLAAIIFVTVVGNLAVIIFFIVDPALRSKVGNLYILNLSCADFLVGVVSLTLNTAWVLRGFWPYGEYVCKFWVVVDFCTCFESVLAIIMISLDRYLLLTCEMKYMVLQTKRRAIIMCSMTWLLAVLIYAPVLLSWSAITGERNIDYSEDCEIEMVDNFAYTVVLLLIEFVIPLLVIGYLNMTVYMNIRTRSMGLFSKASMSQQPSRTNENIAQPRTASTLCDDVSSDRAHQAGNNKRVAWSDGRNAQRGENSSENCRQKTNSPQLQSKHKKAAKTLAVLVSVFVVCWAPYYVYSILVIFCEECFDENAWEVVNYLLWCNSTLNPLLYALTNTRIRNNFLRMFSLGRLRSTKPSNTTTNHNRVVPLNIQ